MGISLLELIDENDLFITCTVSSGAGNSLVPSITFCELPIKTVYHKLIVLDTPSTQQPSPSGMSTSTSQYRHVTTLIHYNRIH